MSKVVRSVKNVTKGYSQVQVKVRNATSNDAWGPTGTEMSEIAQMTFNGSNDFYEIMDMLDKRMNDKGKNWRHVLKSLKVLDYCLHEGSEMVVTWTRKNVYIIRTLREFQHVDEDGRDVGQNIRNSAKELTALLLDEDRLRAERADRKTWKSRVTGIDEYGPDASQTEPPRRRTDRERRNRDNNATNTTGNNDESDLEYRLALEASVNEAEEDAKRRQSRDNAGLDDDDLAKAIKLSKEEEELRRRELEESNTNNLFDLDSPVATNQQQPQYTGWNQGYQQQSAVDWFGNPVGQPQQAQSTGFLNNVYNQEFQSQPTAFNNQHTGMANGYGQQGFDPSQMQQPNYLQQQQTIQPQQTAFNTLNPYAQQQDLFSQQSQQQQVTSPLSAGTNNPWSTPQNHTDALRPMQTGSNNPFASQFAKQQAAQQQNQRPQQPSLETLAEQRTAVQYNNQQQQQQSSYNPITSFAAPQQISQNTTRPAKQELDPAKSRLNALLAAGEGMDTFGNTGDMRIAAQHTAPGTFVNSAGQNLNRLHATQTGNNPFFTQQFTGMPQQQLPAQTGPAGQYGQATNNPFGQRQQPQGNSLIDL